MRSRSRRTVWLPLNSGGPAPNISSVELLPRLAAMLAHMYAPTQLRRLVRALLLVGFVFAPLAGRAADVDLLLVLAADVSRSIDAAKFQLQRDGYTAAVSDSRVLDTIRAGRTGRIGLTFIEWSGVSAQRVVVDWMAIGDAASAKEFGDRLLESPRSFADRTSISGAIEFAMAQLARAPFSGPRQTIDISGDGTNNSGRDVAELRDQAVAKGITVNGLAILSETPLPWNPEHTNPPGGLQHYYRNTVIGGPGAFVMVAKNFDSFGEAIISKLVAEVAQAQEPLSQEPRPQRAAR
ncbi:MAG TPA: DUF1194 domain-containing protein [Xanthobacteraceae bacterium]|nr:DUF1194 domain-containing protein [Xanthobacteraceae bacterium]